MSVYPTRCTLLSPTRRRSTVGIEWGPIFIFPSTRMCYNRQRLKKRGKKKEREVDSGKQSTSAWVHTVKNPFRLFFRLFGGRERDLIFVLLLQVHKRATQTNSQRTGNSSSCTIFFPISYSLTCTDNHRRKREWKRIFRVF